MPLSAEAEKKIQGILDGVTDPAAGTGIPGMVFCAIDKSGKYLTTQTSGTIGLDTKDPVTLDTVFWIASCTKIITGIACLQLWEQGKLDIDSSEQLYKVCPELKGMKVLNKDGQLEDRKGEITIRSLLLHIAGFGYTFFNERLRDYKSGFNEFSGNVQDYVNQPLVNQPGTAWEYGINIDWAGITVERITGMSLDEYFKKNIFKPLGINNISFFPSEHMKQHMVKSHQRDSDGKSSEVKVHPNNAPIAASSDADKAKVFNTGGAGCFAKPAEYCILIATILNDGLSPNTGERILKKETVDEMFKNGVPQFPDFGRQPIAAAKPDQTNPLPEIYPQPGNPPQGWGLTFFITIEPGVTGRGPNTGWWAGIVNLFYWIDRAKGVGGMIASQILPFGDPNVLGAWFGCETAVYEGLQ